MKEGTPRLLSPYPIKTITDHLLLYRRRYHISLACALFKNNGGYFGLLLLTPSYQCLICIRIYCKRRKHKGWALRRLLEYARAHEALTRSSRRDRRRGESGSMSAGRANVVNDDAAEGHQMDVRTSENISSKIKQRSSG